MKKLFRTLTLFLTALASMVFVPSAFAHPLGNFTINQYAALRISRDTIVLDYVLDMAEIPAFQELAPFDVDGDRRPDSSAFESYPADKCASVLADFDLLLNQQALTLTLASSAIELPAGAGGLPTLRLTCEFRASFESAQSTLNLSFVNNAFPDRLGWKEVVVVADGISLNGDFATTSLSNRLTNYPQDLLTSPLDQRQVDVEIQPVAVTMQNSQPIVETVNAPAQVRKDEAFTSLILQENLNFGAWLLALGISFAWGAAHAMTPGHGKTIVGAYLVGSRGTIKHALYLGLTTTITHTLGVFALGLVTLFAARYIVPEKLFPWMSLLSGLFVVGIGLNLFVERFKSSAMGEWLGKLKTRRTSLQPMFESVALHMKQKTRSHRFVLASARGHSHSHNDGHLHDHSHDHTHDHHHEYGHAHSHDHGDHHEHSHDPSGHSHTPPEEITWRSLLALGVSGGLIPCPSALVVMLGAIALNKIGFGIILVLAFSLGLAGALTVMGMLFIYAGKVLNKFPSSGRLIGVLPVFSALFISLIGLGIVYRGLVEVGVI